MHLLQVNPMHTSFQMWVLMGLFMLMLTFLSSRVFSAAGGGSTPCCSYAMVDVWTDMFFLYFAGIMQKCTYETTTFPHCKRCLLIVLPSVIS